MDLSKMSVLSQLSVDELRDLAYCEHPDVRWDMVTAVLLDRAAKQQADNAELATRLRAAEAAAAHALDAIRQLLGLDLVPGEHPSLTRQRIEQAILELQGRGE